MLQSLIDGLPVLLGPAQALSQTLSCQSQQGHMGSLHTLA